MALTLVPDLADVPPALTPEEEGRALYARRREEALLLIAAHVVEPDAPLVETG